MKSAKCAAELGKIIKYSQNMGGNEENLAIFTVILMAAFGTKNVHSVLGQLLCKWKRKCYAAFCVPINFN